MVCRSIQLIAMEKHTKMMKKIISGKGRKLPRRTVSGNGFNYGILPGYGSPQYLHLPSKNR